MVPGSLPIFQPLMCPATMIPAGTAWRCAPVPLKTSTPMMSVVYESKGQLSGSPTAISVVVALSGATSAWR